MPDWRNIWTPARARLWLVALTLSVWLPLLGMPFRRWLDFSAFWAAAKVTFSPRLLDLGSVTVLQQKLGLPIAPFVYPPEVALAYLPLAALPYDVAAVVNVALMTAALLAAAVIGADMLGLPRRWVVLAAFAWPPAAAAVVSGQNTTFGLLLVVLCAAALQRHSLGMAGVAVGVAAYKPQLGLPIAVGLAIRRRWLALAAAGVVAGFHYALGVVATGGDSAWPVHWLELVRDPVWTRADLLQNGWQAIGLPVLLGRTQLLFAGAPSFEWLGYVLAVLVAIPCVGALLRWSGFAFVALVAALGIVFSPHAWLYDATTLLPALGVFAADAHRRRWPSRDRWTLVIAYAVAASWPAGALIAVNPLLLIVVIAPIWLVRRHRADDHAELAARDLKATGTFRP